MKKQLFSIILFSGILLILGGCGGGGLARGNGVDVILQVEDNFPDIQEGETFDLKLGMVNNMECTVTGEGMIRDNVDNNAFGGVFTEEFNFDIDPTIENSQGAKEDWKPFPDDFSGYSYENVDRYGFDAIIIADVTYRCEEDVGAGPTICQDADRCELRESIPREELRADNLPIVVDRIQKRISRGQFGNEITLEITLLQKVDGEPDYNGEKAVFIQAEGLGEGMYTCSPELVEWDGTSAKAKCSLETSDELNDVVTHITLDYDFKASKQATIKVKNDET